VVAVGVVTVVVGADVVVIGVGVLVDGDTVTVVTDALGEGDTMAVGDVLAEGDTVTVGVALGVTFAGADVRAGTEGVGIHRGKDQVPGAGGPSCADALAAMLRGPSAQD
jgi:hypothetical protein